jgi:hypothetical protein
MHESPPELLPAGEARPADVMTLTAAAREIGVAVSTLSRQVKAQKIPNRGTPERPMVSLSEARAARADNLNPLMARTPAPAAAPRAGSIADEQRREKAARAELLELELAERRGELMAADEVRAAFGEAGRVIQAELMQISRDLADELAAMSDPRAIAARLEQAHRQALGSMARQVEALALARANEGLGGAAE